MSMKLSSEAELEFYKSIFEHIQDSDVTSSSPLLPAPPSPAAAEEDEGMIDSFFYFFTVLNRLKKFNKKFERKIFKIIFNY